MVSAVFKNLRSSVIPAERVSQLGQNRIFLTF